MKVLIVGNGGREHALAWKLSQSPMVEQIFVAPGNGGTEHGLQKVENVPIGVSNFDNLVHFARKSNVDMVVPGPEVPLVQGIEKVFRKAGIYCFGPSREAAQMEASKTFAKDFMRRHNIPTAKYCNFTDYEAAKQYIETVDHDVVIKASGLAGGKGVLIPDTKADALDAIKLVMLDRAFGAAGDEVVVEEFLAGEELSIMAFSDGYTIKVLPAAQDHKRIHDGDLGPNTGGMGCYAPTPIATTQLMQSIEQTILKPTIDGMRKERFPFVGLLFTGIMVTSTGPKVLEYNVRFGDPETQAVLPLLHPDTDLMDIFLACVERRLDGAVMQILNAHSTAVVAVSGGYPEAYSQGKAINITNDISGGRVFHAGTVYKNGRLSTAGGRVLAAVSIAPTLKQAVSDAYAALSEISFEGMYYRRDIAARGLAAAPNARDAKLTYQFSGVSVEAGNTFVERIKSVVASTKRPGADADIGGFGGVFDLGSFGCPNIAIVGAIDGIGTKLMVAHSMNMHSTIGIDLVAMNVNDLIVQGAEPLAFLDYFACGKLEPPVAEAFVAGVAEGCRQSNCALIGGETAEMPGMYAPGSYDGAGTAIGIVQKDRLLPDKAAMRAGDVLIGIKSNGAHSNGFSLIRKVLEVSNITYNDTAPWSTGTTVGQSLLTPTKIYVKALMPLIERNMLKGLSHITGGGLKENVPRMLPENMQASIDASKWDIPALFRWLQVSGPIPSEDMCRTFNLGIGMVCVTEASIASDVIEILAASGEEAMIIGELKSAQKSRPSCEVAGLPF